MNRVPPHDIDLEISLLGSLLIDPDKTIIVADYITAESFYKTTHQQIYKAIENLVDEGKKVDPVTVYDEVKKIYKTEINLQHLAQIMDAAVTGELAEEYAMRIKEKADRRIVINETAAAMQSAFDPSVSVTEIVAQIEKSMLGIETTNSKTRQDSSIYDHVIDVWEDFLDNEGKEPDIIKTGFYDLDRLMGGLLYSTTTIVGGRPGMGKTTLGIDLCRNCAAQGKRALLFTMEQSKERVIKKIISQEALISHFDFAVRKQLTEVEKARVTNKLVKIMNLKIGVLDGGWNVHEIRRRCIQEKRQGELDLVVIDYVQILTCPPGIKFETRNSELTYYSWYLQQMAIELGISLVILSQVGRDTEKRMVRRPVLKDLKESGGLEQNCDNVIFIFRESEYDPDANPGIAELIVAKNRDGQTGTVKVAWIPHATTFRNLDRQERVE